MEPSVQNGSSLQEKELGSAETLLFLELAPTEKVF